MEEYYTSSSGEKKKISEMNTEYLINALGKKYREIYNCITIQEYVDMCEEINALKNEIHKRMNTFADSLENKE